jgi:hypothetical protein
LNTFLCLLEQAVAQLPSPTVLAMVTKQTLTTNFINWMPFVGVILNNVGSILSAFSLNKTTKMLNTSITALEHLKDTLLSKGDIVSFTGMNIHRNKAVKNSKILTLIGLHFISCGFYTSIITAAISSRSRKNYLVKHDFNIKLKGRYCDPLKS